MRYRAPFGYPAQRRGKSAIIVHREVSGFARVLWFDGLVAKCVHTLVHPAPECNGRARLRVIPRGDMEPEDL